MAISEIVKKGIQRDSFKADMQREIEILRLRYGADQVYDLTPEYPEQEPPQNFGMELQKIFSTPRGGLHRYMENAGYIATRSAIAAQLKQASGLPFSEAEVIMTSGASGAINMAIKAVLNPAEEVLLFAPIAYDYEAYVTNHAGVLRIIPCLSDFTPDLNALEAALNPRTKVVIINSPNNPSGAVYPDELLKEISQIISRRSAAFNTRIYLVSDDTYRKFYYGPAPCPWILKYYPHTIIVSSYSKEFSIPGERIGFTAISPLCEESKVVVGGLIHANRTLGFVNAPALMQNTLTDLQGVGPEVSAYRARRDFIHQQLSDMGYRSQLAMGGFFQFVRSPLDDDARFVRELARQRVFTLPGSLFHASGYFRVSYCVEQSRLEKALPGFRQALANLQRNTP